MTIPDSLDLPCRSGQPAAFLDRDGTIIEDSHYLGAPDSIVLLPGAVEGMRLLREAGYLLICVTNQSGVARGYFSERELRAIHKRMRTILADNGVPLDGIYYCPHHPDIGDEPYQLDCDCRKPRPGMLLAAARDLDIDLPASVLIGDAERDIEAGHAAGCRTILRADDPTTPTRAGGIAANLKIAAEIVLGWA